MRKTLTKIEGVSGDHIICALLTGTSSGRTSDRQITIFDGVGFAVEDFSALRWLRDRVSDHDISKPLDLIADPDDPRDLFGMLKRYTGGPRR